MEPDYRLDYVCVECGGSIKGRCDHVYSFATGYCHSAPNTAGNPELGNHALCPGTAAGKPEGTCPCSCHIKVTESEIEAATSRLMKLESELSKEVK